MHSHTASLCTDAMAQLDKLSLIQAEITVRIAITV